MARGSVFAAMLAFGAVPEARAAEHPIGADVPPVFVPRDVFLTAPRGGTWASFDAYTAGVQATLERRFSIQRDDYAAIVPRVNTLASLGFGEVAAHTDVRFLFFSAGVTAGYRRVWRTYAFAPDVAGTREVRSALDDEKSFTTESWGYGEGRLRMVLPVADPVLFMGNAAIRYEDCPNNSFDWLHTTMHDRGWLFRYDATVFFRSQTLGAIGPTVRVMDLPRRGERELELAVGFTGGRRIGLLKNDLFLANVLTRPGDDSFGFQILKMPVYALLVYRVSVEL
ncbi:MAG: hypothetical protein KIT84_34235 [Labilithrix sp.]|nr:hypothetical protein [Labilithrix sp.]